MNPQLPVVDDTQIWDAMLGLYNTPAITVAIELEVFESLKLPQTAEELTTNMGYSLRGVAALLGMLKALNFLDKHQEKYQLTELSRTYMLKDSPFFWGSFFSFTAQSLPMYKPLIENIRDGETVEERGAADGWESGQMDPELARSITDYMHCHSVAPSVGLSQTCDFSGVSKLLDVGGGSGCFSIALANHYPNMHCTVMELPPICSITNEYIEKGGVADRVNSQPVDMFRDAWPEGYDAHFFANVFHDWDFKTCTELAEKSYQALLPGGKIYLQEMLLDGSSDTPYPAVAFSFLMTVGTKGQQFTFQQLTEILSKAGFSDFQVQRSYGYYSLVSATKAG